MSTPQTWMQITHIFLPTNKALAAPISIPPCRGGRHQSAFSKQTSHSFTLQILLLASHQLSMMTMASHHRLRHPATLHRRRLVTASHRQILVTASHRHLLVAASHRRRLLAASHRSQLLAASHRQQPPSCAARLHLTWSPPSCHDHASDLQALIPIVGAARCSASSS
jgi:hypothetical protein